jgi:hypothetical protein
MGFFGKNSGSTADNIVDNHENQLTIFHLFNSDALALVADTEGAMITAEAHKRW